MWFERNLRKRADRLLVKGRTADAMKLYRQAEAWDALAESYERQGNLQSAAEAAEKGALYGQAAQFHEQLGAFRKAAEMWLRAERKDCAALALERAGDFEEAARLRVEIGEPARAAGALAVLGRHSEAARLYEQADEPANAVAAYRKAGLPAEAARVSEAAGDLAEAARLRCEAGEWGPAAALFEKARLPAESARCYVELHDYAKAGEVLERVGSLADAAELYEEDDATVEKAAQIFSTALRTQVAWEAESKTRALCFGVSECGTYIALGCATGEARLFRDTGDAVWTFTPLWRGSPSCVSVARNGVVALGCDDHRLYLIRQDKTLLWTKDLPGDAKTVSIAPSGERLACCTKDNVVLYMDKDGQIIWEYPVGTTVCDLSLSADGKVVAAGTVRNACLFLTSEGKLSSQFQAPDWVDCVSLNADGTMCALGLGMAGVALLDVARPLPLWSAQDGSPVQNVALTPCGAVLSVADDAATLRDRSGNIIWRHAGRQRLLGGGIDDEQRAVVLARADAKLTRLNLQHCRARAAEDYERAGNLREAAVLYEGIQAHSKAAELFKAAGDLEGAARNAEIVGTLLEAAELFESAGSYAKAAPVFEAQGNLLRAANCYKQAGDLIKAAGLFEQVGELGEASDLYELTEQHARAGALHRAAGNRAAAIDALKKHVDLHPDDADARMDLGLLLQEDQQYDEAIVHFQRAGAHEKHERKALVRAAECFVAKGLYDVAVDRYLACVKEGERVSLDNLEVYYGLAKAYELAGNYAEAKRIFESVLAIDYQYRDVRERLSEVDALGAVFTGQQKSATRYPPTRVLAQQTLADNPYQELSAATKERYVVKKELGKGGMGIVYLAEDKRLRRLVALKILPPHLAADGNLRARMIREAQAAAQIDHPNCVRVFDVAEERDRCYMTMEYVTGETARSLLERQGPLDPRQCVDLLLQITDGLAYAHKKGITHRDIKPENMIITEDGTAKVMDFGLALAPGVSRLTVQGGVCGTIPYMAPEQLRGVTDLPPATDVYALGCVAYELLTGKLPFEGVEGAMNRLVAPPKPLGELRPELPPSLVEVVNKCLQMEPADRYVDGASLNSALRAVAEQF